MDKREALITEAIYHALERVTHDEKTREIDLNLDLVASHGLDSLEIASFFLAVEEECNVDLPESIEASPITIASVAKEVARTLELKEL